MFLSKKLLIDQWNPEVIEYYSTKSVSASSSTRLLADPLFVGADKIFYRQSSYLRSITIADAANTQADAATGNGFYFAEGDSDATTQTFYSYAQTSSNITFGKLDVNTVAETATHTTSVKTWSKTMASILTMFGDAIIWGDTTSSSCALKNNTTTLLSGSGGFGYVGKPNSTSVYVSNGNNVYTTTTSAANLYFTKSVSGTPKYLQNKFYIILYSPTFTLIKLTTSGIIEWQKTFYADENNTVPITMKILGTNNGKFYGVSFPTSSDATSPYYKLVIWEIDMATGNVLHQKDLPTPRVVTDGLITANTILNYSIGNFSMGIVPKNRRFALPIVAGYTKSSVFYHDWFVITIPE